MPFVREHRRPAWTGCLNLKNCSVLLLVEKFDSFLHGLAEGGRNSKDCNNLLHIEFNNYE